MPPRSDHRQQRSARRYQTLPSVLPHSSAFSPKKHGLDEFSPAFCRHAGHIDMYYSRFNSANKAIFIYLYIIKRVVLLTNPPEKHAKEASHSPVLPDRV